MYVEFSCEKCELLNRNGILLAKLKTETAGHLRNGT